LKLIFKIKNVQYLIICSNQDQNIFGKLTWKEKCLNEFNFLVIATLQVLLDPKPLLMISEGTVGLTLMSVKKKF